MSIGDHMGTLEPNAGRIASHTSRGLDSSGLWSGRSAIPARARGRVIPSDATVRRSEMLPAGQLRARRECDRAPSATKDLPTHSPLCVWLAVAAPSPALISGDHSICRSGLAHSSGELISPTKERTLVGARTVFAIFVYQCMSSPRTTRSIAIAASRSST